MKRTLTTILQVAISVALIVWIFHDPEKRAEMAAALRKAEIGWFLPGLAAMGLVLLLQAYRWFLLVRAIGIPLTWWRTAQLYMIGMFFNLFLLGATGGDVVKIFYAMREAGRDKAAAFLSIVLDRVIGLLALATVSAAVVAWKFQAYMATPVAQGLLATIALILGGAIGVVVVAALVAILKLENRLPERMPMRRAIVDLAVATQRYAKTPGTLLAAFALSIPAHLLLFSTFYFSARAFSAALSLGDTFSVMPIVNTITSLPISFSGIGVREQLFENLLDGLYGVPQATAVLISMGGYLISVAWCLVGGAIYLFYRPGDVSLREMTAETEQVAEHPTP